jgi:APA family basic amino acid/polyamine antiporter
MDGILERRKPVDEILADSRAAGEGGEALKRELGVWGITALGIGAIVGTGIFVLTGHAAATSAGPGIVISFVIAGFVSALAALCYAELASTVPVAGSAYTYVYATLGEFVAWIVGWGLILEYALGAATVAIGWSGYFGDFLHATFGLALPKSLTTNPFEGGIANVPAAAIILLISALLIRGTQESSSVNKVIVAVKLAVVAFFIVIGSRHIDPANWHPFAPFGLKGIINGAGLVFFAYIGFDAVSTSAEEVRNPERDLPRGIIGSLAVCTVLYILVSGILTGILPYTKLNVPSPVSYSLIEIGLGWAGAIVAVGAIAGLTTVLLVMLYGQSRVFFAMSRDGLLPGVFSRIHPTFRTPYLSSALIGIIVAFVAAIGELDVVADLVNIGTLAAFALVSVGVVVLRRRSPDLRRGFRVPFSPAVPILSAVSAIALIFNGLPLRTIAAYFIWLAIGLAVYFSYSRRHSKLAPVLGAVAPRQ